MKDNTASNTNNTIFLGLVIALIFFLFRGAFPFLKYPSILLFTAVFFYISIAKYKTITITTIYYIKQFYLPIIVIIYYFVGILNTSRMYTTLAQEIISHLTLFGGIFLSYLYLKKQNELKHFLDIFNYSVFYLSIVIAIYSLIIFFSLDYVLPDFLREQELIDGNFALLPGFLSVLIVANIAYQRTVGNGNKILFFTTFTLFLLQLVFSSSRRGLFLALIINGIILLLITYSLFKKSIFIKRIAKVLQLFLVSSLLSLTLVVGIYKVPSTIKNKFLINAGILDTYPVKQRIALGFYKLINSFDSQTNFNDIYIDFWSSAFNPKDPDTGWGSGLYEKQYELKGKNSEIIPENAIGLKIDKRTVKPLYDTTLFYNADIFTTRVKEGQILFASVYCFVSKDFNGDYVSLNSSGAVVEHQNSNYLMSRKGEWQKISTKLFSTNGYLQLKLSLRKNSIVNDHELTGHVIFAYPEIILKEMNELNPKTPSSGWGNLVNKEVFPQYGKNAEIVPDSSIGIEIPAMSINYESKHLRSSVTSFLSSKVNKLDRVKGSVYCFVSDSFAGQEVALIGAGLIGNTKSQYNLRKKGEWQKLEISGYGINSYVSLKGIFNITDSTLNSDNLSGEVIFAYPELSVSQTMKFDPKNPQSGWGIGFTPIKVKQSNNSQLVPNNSYGIIFDKELPINYNISKNWVTAEHLLHALQVKKGHFYNFSIYYYVSKDFSFDKVQLYTGNIISFYKAIEKPVYTNIDINKREYWQEISINFIAEKDGIVPIFMHLFKRNSRDFSDQKGYIFIAYPKWEDIKMVNKSSAIFRTFNNIFAGTISRLNMEIYVNGFQSVGDAKKDPIRGLLTDLVSEDSTYYPYKADITVDSVGRDLGQDRLIRWKFALDLFVKEYTWKEKIFGGGFDFLSWYGKVFHNNHMRPDYPHNPFLHILLYGGIVGLSLYLWLLARVLQLYWRYRKEYGIFLLMWGVVYYFTLFSGGDPFNPPVMGFFMLLPFLIHAVHQREVKE